MKRFIILLAIICLIARVYSFENDEEEIVAETTVALELTDTTELTTESSPSEAETEQSELAGDGSTTYRSVRCMN